MVAETFYDHAELALAQRLGDVTEHLHEARRQALFEQQPTRRCLDVNGLAAVVALGEFDLVVQVYPTVVDGTNYFVHLTEDTNWAVARIAFTREVIATDDEVLLRCHDRATRSRRQNVVGAEHQHACFSLSLDR